MEDKKKAPLTAEQKQARKRSGRQALLVLSLLIVVLAVAAAAVIGFLKIKPVPDTVQGQGDATEIRISGKLPGRVVDIYVSEGEHVKAGQKLIHIHSSVMNAKKEQATAMVNVADATNEKVDAGTRVQIINGAEDVYHQAIAARDIAEKTYTRMSNLYDKGVVSAQKRDEAKAAFEAAKAGAEAAKSQWELAKAGAQKEDKQAARAMVQASQAGVKEANALLEDQVLVAPCDGIITVIYPHASELVMTGAPLMTLQQDDPHAVFNVRETLLKDITEGTEIRCWIPALDKEETFTVYYIQDMGSYANWQATKATGSYDARTFEIKARPNKHIEGFRPGMSVIYKGVVKKK